eukprot:364775-Chlamydomonas_euryale.AAC.3
MASVALTPAPWPRAAKLLAVRHQWRLKMWGPGSIAVALASAAAAGATVAARTAVKAATTTAAMTSALDGLRALRRSNWTRRCECIEVWMSTWKLGRELWEWWDTDLLKFTQTACLSEQDSCFNYVIN